jgi:hypothetical protein
MLFAQQGEWSLSSATYCCLPLTVITPQEIPEIIVSRTAPRRHGGVTASRNFRSPQLFKLSIFVIIVPLAPLGPDVPLLSDALKQSVVYPFLAVPVAQARSACRCVQV